MNLISLYEDVYFLIFRNLTYVELKNVYRTCISLSKYNNIERFQKIQVDNYIRHKINLNSSQKTNNSSISKMLTENEVITQVMNKKIIDNCYQFMKLSLSTDYFQKLLNFNKYEVLYNVCYHDRVEIFYLLIKYIPYMELVHYEITYGIPNRLNHGIYNLVRCDTKYLKYLINDKIITFNSLYLILDNIVILENEGKIVLNDNVVYNLYYILTEKLENSTITDTFDKIIMKLNNFLFPKIFNNYLNYIKPDIDFNNPLVIAYNNFVKLLIDYNLINRDIITIRDIKKILTIELTNNNFQLALYIITSLNIICDDDLLRTITCYSKDLYINYLYENGYFINDMNMLLFLCCQFDRSEIVKVLIRDNTIDLTFNDNVFIVSSAYYNSKKTLRILINIPKIKNLLTKYQVLEYGFKLNNIK